MRFEHSQRFQQGTRFERLEHRDLMAADLTAAVVNGTLFVQGGDDDAHVSVFQATGDQFKVFGQEGTLINGATTVTLAGVKNIQITMGDGDNYVLVRNSVISGNVSYVVGDGENYVKIQSCVVAGNVNVRVGNGPSEVFIGLPIATSHGPSYDTQIGGLVDIVAGDGGAEVLINSAKANAMRVATGAGNDKVTVHNAAANVFFAILGDGDDKLSTNAGIGNNTFGSFVFNGGNGNDTYQPASSTSIGRLALIRVERLLNP